MDIREKTCIIVRKNGEYLVGRIMGTNLLKWSTSPWDEWNTRKKREAEDVARQTGGILVLFNPISKETRLMGT